MATKIFGLIGYPLGHSFSRKFFNNKFRNEDIDAEYRNFEIDDISLAGNIFLQSEICGLNVTIPYKQQIIPLLNEVDKDAQAIGSVNVIKFVRKGELVKTIGFNTDIIGFHDSIAPHIRSHHKSALILGTGGASKAVAHCLRSLGISIDFASRTSGNGKMAYTDLTEQIVSSHQIIVNTTPLGMFPNVDACPDIPYQGISSSHICFDLTYNPAETLFLRKSKQYGADTINGMEMLIGQALAAWRIRNDKAALLFCCQSFSKDNHSFCGWHTPVRHRRQMLYAVFSCLGHSNMPHCKNVAHQDIQIRHLAHLLKHVASSYVCLVRMAMLLSQHTKQH